MRKYLNRSLAAVMAVVLFPALVMAAPATDYDGIIGAVDWTDVVLGITAIAALIAAVLVVMRGSRMLLRMIGR